jgi:hypothetical protein
MRKIFLILLSIIWITGCNFSELKDALDQSVEKSWYGNWCGPDHSGPAEPIDEMDAYCKEHDLCYGAITVTFDYWQCIPDKAACDKQLVDKLNALSDNPQAWTPPAAEPVKAIQYRDDAYTIFEPCALTAP